MKTVFIWETRFFYSFSFFYLFLFFLCVCLTVFLLKKLFPVKLFHSQNETDTVEKSIQKLFFQIDKRTILAHFSNSNSETYKVFAKVASILREECEFFVSYGYCKFVYYVWKTIYKFYKLKFCHLKISWKIKIFLEVVMGNTTWFEMWFSLHIKEIRDYSNCCEAFVYHFRQNLDSTDSIKFLNQHSHEEQTFSGDLNNFDYVKLVFLV